MTLKFNRVLEVVKVQNFIKLSAAVHELSTVHFKRNYLRQEQDRW